MWEQNQKAKIQEVQSPKNKGKFIPKTADDSQDEQQVVKIQNKNKEIKKIDHKLQRWTVSENKTYVKFLEEHAHLFRYKSVRRVRQVFILLSDKMNRKKTPAQCKSHHQKMRKATQRGTIKQIIRYMKRKHVSKQRVIAMKQMEMPIINKQNNEIKEDFEITARTRYNKLHIQVKIREAEIEIW